MGNLHFVTGKGGVGKSCFAQWYAKQEGLVLTDLAHLSRKEIYSQFVSSAFHLPWIKSFLQKSDLFDNLLQLAPNLFELLALQEWQKISKKNKTRDLLIDAPSTGNFISLIGCVRTALDVFDGGAMRKIADDIEKDFQSSTHRVTIVTLPEESSLSELHEIEKAIRKSYPHWIFENCLNRLHHPVTSVEGLSPNLREIATLRPEREKRRTQNQSFRWSFSEGDLPS